MNKNLFLIVAFSLLSIIVLQAQNVFTLDKSIEQALQTSPRILKSKLSLQRNDENLKAQRARLKSNFSLDLKPFNYSNNSQFNNQLSKWYNVEQYSGLANFRISQPILFTDGVISLNNTFDYRKNKSSSGGNISRNEGFSNRLDLSLNQPLFTYNKTKLQLKELELAYENAALSYALQELNIENIVTQAFYRVYKTQMALQVSKEELNNSKLSLELIRNKVDGGLVAKDELYQAELNMLSSESSYKDKEVNFQNNLDQFKQMLGIDLDENVMIMADISVPDVQVDLNKAIEYGLKNRMELRQREIAIEQGQFNLIRTNAQNEFKGDLMVRVGLFGKDEKINNLFDEPSNSQDVSVGLKIPLWDWGEKRARIRAAEVALESSKIDLSQEQINIKLTIRSIYRNLQNLLCQIQIARKNIDNAKLTYEINLEKYKNGDLTSMELNLVQNQLTQKKNQLTNSIINYKLELLNLKIQTMYDFDKQEEVSKMIDVRKFNSNKKNK